MEALYTPASHALECPLHTSPVLRKVVKLAALKVYLSGFYFYSSDHI